MIWTFFFFLSPKNETYKMIDEVQHELLVKLELFLTDANKN
jgi:hypothetical protein